jgi:hypothetical protein
MHFMAAIATALPGRGRVFTATVLVILVMGAPSVLRAQAKVFSFCYVPLTGTVYRIKEADVRQTCSSTAHVEFSVTDGMNALRTGDAAAGDLAGTFPGPSVVRLRGQPFSSALPAAGQVLGFDGTSWIPTTPPTGGGGVSDHGALSGLGNDDHPQYLLGNGVRNLTDGFAFTGTFGSGNLVASGAGTRLLWYPAKAAFRVGRVVGAQWDDANIGLESIALGSSTRATGRSSLAAGTGSDALGDFSVAIGNPANATAPQSVALGFALASGTGSLAMGSSVFASGNFSTAVGNRAHTNGREGAIVFGDRSSSSNVLAASPNSFTVRAAGGTTFFSDAAMSAGVSLAPGAGAWTAISDVNRKHLFRVENGEVVLQKIATLPIRSWSYKSQDSSIRHLGPTAQDFRAAFGLGESELGISTIDIDGVNLLAAQALEKRTRELKAENATLRAELADLRARLARVEGGKQ